MQDHPADGKRREFAETARLFPPRHALLVGPRARRRRTRRARHGLRRAGRGWPAFGRHRLHRPTAARGLSSVVNGAAATAAPSTGSPITAWAPDPHHAPEVAFDR